MGFWKLNYENWNFENHLRIGVLKIKLWIGVLQIKFKRIWIFERLFENGILKIKFGILEILKNCLKKLNLRIEILKN